MLTGKAGMISDDQIIAGCKKGKRHAFNRLYQKYASTMMSICMRYSGSRSEAEDILQEGFIRIFKKINSFEGRGSFEGWLKRIMVNTAINYYKTNKKYRNHNSLDTESGQNLLSVNADEFIEDEGSFKQEELMKMINELPEGYRMVFNLYVFEGMTHQEISGILECSISNSKSQLSKARRYLRKQIEEKQKKSIRT